MARRLSPSDLLKVASRGDVEEVTKLLHMSSTNQSESRDSYAALLNVTDNSGQTALHLAIKQCNNVAIQTLVCAGADINRLNNDGKNALMLAVADEDAICLKILIRLRADLNMQARGKKYGTKDYIGPTALMYAANYRNSECLKLLLDAGADVNVKTSEGQTALHWALKFDCEILSSCGSSFHSDTTKCVKKLIAYGANVNVQTSDGETALMWAIKWHWRRSDIACFSEIAQNLQILIDAGADVNVQTTDGKTALMYAVECVGMARDGISNSDATACVRVLINFGADVRIQTSRGQTVLEEAVIMAVVRRNTNGPAFTECVKILIDAKADVTNPSRPGGPTLLMHAVQSDYLVHLLPTLVNAGIVVNQQLSDGTTALACAVSKGTPKCVRWLIESGASVNICDHQGRSPLHRLFSWKNLQGFNDQLAKQCLEVLLSQETNVDIRDNNGMTPLMYMAQKAAPSTDTMTMLLQHGADLDLVDNRGQTALIHSLKLEDESHGPIDTGNARFLLSMGANFSKGKLAAGKLAFLTKFDQDIDLIKLQVGKDVSLEITWDDFSAMITQPDYRRILLFLFTNGVMPIQPIAIHEPEIFCNGAIISYSASPLLEVVLREGLLGIIKYLIATCYLRSADLVYSSTVSQKLRRLSRNPAVVTIIENLRSQPWPLVKLCFVAVSTAFGASPGRQERVKNSQLPPKLQKMLLFQEPWSRLCVNQWDKIPLTFNPGEYEKLPRPRPLLYHWPVGRELVPCDCGKCDETLFKYSDGEEHEENTEEQ